MLIPPSGFLPVDPILLGVPLTCWCCAPSGDQTLSQSAGQGYHVPTLAVRVVSKITLTTI